MDKGTEFLINLIIKNITYREQALKDVLMPFSPSERERLKEDVRLLNSALEKYYIKE